MTDLELNTQFRKFGMLMIKDKSDDEAATRYSHGGQILDKEDPEGMALFEWAMSIDFPPDAWPKGSRVRQVRDHVSQYPLHPLGSEGIIVGVTCAIVPPLFNIMDLLSTQLSELGYLDKNLIPRYTYLVHFDGDMHDDEQIITMIVDIKLELL